MSPEGLGSEAQHTMHPLGFPIRPGEEEEEEEEEGGRGAAATTFTVSGLLYFPHRRWAVDTDKRHYIQRNRGVRQPFWLGGFGLLFQQLEAKWFLV
ncbi:unnamed protein product [Arctogadus glacialis]